MIFISHKITWEYLRYSKYAERRKENVQIRFLIERQMCKPYSILSWVIRWPRIFSAPLKRSFHWNVCAFFYTVVQWAFLHNSEFVDLAYVWPTASIISKVSILLEQTKWSKYAVGASMFTRLFVHKGGFSWLVLTCNSSWSQHLQGNGHLQPAYTYSHRQLKQEQVRFK